MEYNGITLTDEQIWIVGIAAVITYIIRAFYCLTIKKTFDLIAKENQFLSPNLVWLALIPVFSIYWNFVIAMRLSDSLTNEFYDRKIPEEENPGRNTGILYAAFAALASFPLIPQITLFVGLMGIFYFFKYWVKVNKFKNLLKAHNLHGYPAVTEDDLSQKEDQSD